jgi:hypothetical protein
MQISVQTAKPKSQGKPAAPATAFPFGGAKGMTDFPEAPLVSGCAHLSCPRAAR